MKLKLLLTGLALCVSTICACAGTNTLGAPVLQGNNSFSGINLMTNAANVLTGNGSGITGLTSGVAVAAGTNIVAVTNGQVVTINGTSYVTPSITNGLASTNYVNTATNYARTNVFYGNGAGLTNLQSSNISGSFAGLNGGLTNADGSALLSGVQVTNIANALAWSGGGTFSNPVYQAGSSANAPANNELITASWVIGIFAGSGVSYYASSNTSTFTNSGWTNVFTFQTNIPAYFKRSYTNLDNGTYIGIVVTTNRFMHIDSDITVNAYLELSTGGPDAATVHPEIYYSYTGTNAWAGDWDSPNQALVKGATNLFSWVMQNPSYDSTNATGFYIARAFKQFSKGGSPTITFHGGTNFASHITLPGVSTTGSANLAANQTWTGTNTFTGAVEFSGSVTGAGGGFIPTNNDGTIVIQSLNSSISNLVVNNTNVSFYTNSAAKAAALTSYGPIVLTNSGPISVAISPNQVFSGSNAVIQILSNGVPYLNIGTNGTIVTLGNIYTPLLVAASCSVSTSGALTSGLSYMQSPGNGWGIFYNSANAAWTNGFYIGLTNDATSLRKQNSIALFGIWTNTPWSGASNIAQLCIGDGRMGFAANGPSIAVGIATNQPQATLHVNGSTRTDGYICFGSTNTLPTAPTTQAMSNTVFLYGATSGTNFAILKAMNGQGTVTVLSPHPQDGPGELYTKDAPYAEEIRHNLFTADGSHEWINLTRLANQIEAIKTQLGLTLPPVIMTETADDYYSRTSQETPEVQQQIDASMQAQFEADALGIEYTPPAFVKSRIDAQAVIKAHGGGVIINP